MFYIKINLLFIYFLSFNQVSILFGNRATANMSGISAQSTVDKFPQTLAGFNVAFNGKFSHFVCLPLLLLFYC